MIITHLGQDVWLLSSFPYNQSAYLGSQFIDDGKLLKDILKYNKKRIIAITTREQARAGEALEKAKFKKYFTFKSSHNNIDESLTLWVKISKNAPDSSKSPINEFPWNCTVRLDRAAELKSLKYADPVVLLTLQKEGESIEDLEKLGFERIARTRIFAKFRKDAFSYPDAFHYKKDLTN